MKQALINYVKKGLYDEYKTPPEAVYPLLKYIPKDWVCWEPTDDGTSGITKVLKENGYKVISTHVRTGFNFLTKSPDFHFDVIITNPPYSLKTEFLKRAYMLGKPFAFLLPITALEGKERFKLYRRYGIQLLVLDKRVEFIEDKNRVWFAVAWFCWKVLPKDLIFERLFKVPLWAV